MILTGSAIREAVEAGKITIAPFDRGLVNPNSYNYRLGTSLRVVEDVIADPMRPSAIVSEVVMPETGYLLLPGRVYLASTVEVIGSSTYVTSLVGRSSMGRLGVFLQVSADLGQLGTRHHWTLEIVVAQPVRLYPGMRIGQVSFWTVSGAISRYRGHFGSLPWSSESTPVAFRSFAEEGEP